MHNQTPKRPTLNPTQSLKNGNIEFDYGGRHTIVGEPLTVVEEYVAVWKKARLDTDELARPRFGEGWTINRLQNHFGYSRTTIKRELKRVARH